MHPATLHGIQDPCAVTKYFEGQEVQFETVVQARQLDLQAAH